MTIGDGFRIGCGIVIAFFIVSFVMSCAVGMLI